MERPLTGRVRLEVTSADIPGLLLAVSHALIPVYDLTHQDDLTVFFTVDRKDYRQIRMLLKRRGERVKLNRRLGAYWKLTALIYRPVLTVGLILVLLLILYLPTRVFFVRVEGNSSVPTRLILEKAKQCGIIFGADRSAVRSERMKNALLEEIPELQWAGINTSGCVATISVRERSDDLQEEEILPYTVRSIVAARDGVIQWCTVTNGTALCAPGQAVKAGEVLISGYTDCGICIRAGRAEGEVFAETNRILQVKVQNEQMLRGEQTGEITKYSLKIGNFRINFYEDSGILDTSCVKMYSENYMTLPGGFQLPVAIVTEVCTYYDCEDADRTQEESERIMREFVDSYLQSQMVAGRILQRQEVIDGYVLYGNYACLEMIGQIRYEESIINYGENNGENG